MCGGCIGTTIQKFYSILTQQGFIIMIKNHCKNKKNFTKDLNILFLKDPEYFPQKS